MDDPALELQGVSKTYRTLARAVPALGDVSLRIQPGQIVGLVGPNGSGKSTLLHLCLGYLRADGGTIRVLGRPPDDVPLRSRLGWMPEHPTYPRGTTGFGFVEDSLSGYGVPRAERRRRTRDLFARFDLDHAGGRLMSGYSRGMLQKAALIHALAHRPDLLLLDEPTSGMDPIGIRQVRRELRAFREKGGTVLLSSHILSELVLVSDRALFLSRGRLQREEVLGGDGGGTPVSVRVEDAGAAREALETACPPWFSDWALEEGTLTGIVRPEERLAELVAFLVGKGARVRSVVERQSDLEAIFFQIERKD